MIDAYLEACSHPWAIEESALRNLLSIADRGGDVEALQRKFGDRLPNTRKVELRDNGVAVIPMNGPIFRYANLFTDISGATSLQVMATDLQAALDDPKVRAILFDIDSPGGDARGIAEMARAINDGRIKKRIGAYIGGTGASAAYWLASATGDVTVDRTALVGSIGVVATYRDERQKDEKAGVRTVEFVSSISPNKRPDPLTEAGAAQIQKVVDSLAAVFVTDVAAFREVSIGTVTSKFGQGGLLMGQHAVSAGMADQLGDLESTIARLGAGGSSVSRSQASSNAPASPTARAEISSEIFARRAKERIGDPGAAPQQSAHAASWADSASRVYAQRSRK
jgi:capsid assembly protease